MRFLALIIALVATLICCLLGQKISPYFHLLTAIALFLLFVGVWDLIQVRHSITRNYPILAHLRFLQEMIRPEIHIILMGYVCLGLLCLVQLALIASD